MLNILWRDKESYGFRDEIPSIWFESVGERAEASHYVIGPKGKPFEAKCSIKVTKSRADLNYEAFAHFNKKKGNLLGILRIDFFDATRKRVKHVSWKVGKEEFRKFDDEVSVEFFDDPEEDFDSQVLASLNDDEARKKRLAKADPIPKKTKTVTQGFRRNADVVAEVLKRANGVCEDKNCRKPGPFVSRVTGLPYLEVHHKTRLADGGEDTVSNALALCPNCHRKAHFGLPAGVVL